MTRTCRALGALLTLALVGCSTQEPDAGGREGPPYIATLVKLDALTGVEAGGPYAFRIQELSGTLGVDTTVRVALPTDTVIISVPNATATYVITLDGLPAKCTSKYGPRETIIVPENTNTTIARFFVTCRPLLRLVTTVEGSARDDEIFYRLSGGGPERIGSIRPTAAIGSVAVDTLLLEDMAPGTYRLELANLAENCTAISPGLRAPAIEVPAEGGLTVPLRITCADPARRPRLAQVASTAGQGAVAFTAVVLDPQRDADWYSFDITDCRGYSVRQEDLLTRRGLFGLPTAGDTLRLAVAVPIQRGDAAALVGRCLALRVWDVEGNSTPVLETPVRANDGTSLTIEAFNAVLVQRTELRLNLGIAGGAFAGIFPTIEVRDGILFGNVDGAPDIGIYGVGGYTSVDRVPALRIGTRFQDFDLLASVVYVLDAAANFTRLRDDDLTR